MPDVRRINKVSGIDHRVIGCFADILAHLQTGLPLIFALFYGLPKLTQGVFETFGPGFRVRKVVAVSSGDPVIISCLILAGYKSGP
jgi:hypothetical protein